MLYYEIVRIDTNHSEDAETFALLDKLVRRGWTRKALETLTDWDYGGENIDTAMALHALRDTPTEESRDSVIREEDGYMLCASHCPSGLYDAYYLVRGISALALASFD